MRFTSTVFAFVLGACAATAVQTQQRASAQRAPTVVSLKEAPKAAAPNDKAFIQHLAKGDNAYLGRLEMEPGAQVPEHRDATEEYIHVLAGQGTITIDDRAYELKAGSTVYMPANAKVRYQNGAERMVAIQVFAGPAPSAKYEKWKKASP